MLSQVISLYKVIYEVNILVLSYFGWELQDFLSSQKNFPFCFEVSWKPIQNPATSRVEYLNLAYHKTYFSQTKMLRVQSISMNRTAKVHAQSITMILIKRKTSDSEMKNKQIETR